MTVNQSTTMAPIATGSGKHPGKDTFITLCIPRVFMNITEKRIRHTFYQLKLGFITKIDMVLSKTPKGENIYKVFIHFKHFFENNNAQQALNTLKEGKEIKVIYDDPWFWKVFEYKKPSKTTNRNQSSNSFQSKNLPIITNIYNEIKSSTSTDNMTNISCESTIVVQKPINEESEAPRLDYGTVQWPKKKKLMPIQNSESNLEEGEIKE